MNEKQILFWIHRILEEHISNQKKALERISVLNHQAENFIHMDKKFQAEVMQCLYFDAVKFGWETTTIKEIEGLWKN